MRSEQCQQIGLTASQTHTIRSYLVLYILKGNVESRDTVLNTWEVELYKVIVEDGKLNYDFIPTSLFRGCPLIRG